MYTIQCCRSYIRHSSKTEATKKSYPTCKLAENPGETKLSSMRHKTCLAANNVIVYLKDPLTVCMRKKYQRKTAKIAELFFSKSYVKNVIGACATKFQ